MPAVHSLKIKKEIKKFKSIYIYQKELYKAYFQQNMTCGNFKDLNRRTAADKLLRNKAFNIAKNPKYDGYQRGLASMIHNFFDKKFLVEQLKMKLFLIKN